MNNQEILTPKEHERNDEQRREIELKHELIELIRSQEAVLIVGAGSSKRVRYLDWPDLLKELESLAGKCGSGFKPNPTKREDEPLEYAQDIKSHISKQMAGDLSEYYALLERSFEPREFSSDELQFHKTLVNLPFKGILTTNYDVVLEEALKATGQLSAYENSFIVNKDAAGQVHRFFLAMNTVNELAIAHLHGKYDNPKNIILSSKDYERAYDGFAVAKETSRLISHLTSLLVSPLLGFSFFNSHSENQVQRSTEWTLHRKLLWAVLATCRVVFIGFSMKDPYFKKMLETVAKDLWRGNKPVHFAIRNISLKKTEAAKAREEAETLKRDCGVETLFYEDTNGNHEGLVDIIDKIAEECGVETPSTVVPQDLLADNDRSANEQPKSITGKPGNKLDQIKQMSQRMARRIGDED